MFLCVRLSLIDFPSTPRSTSCIWDGGESVCTANKSHLPHILAHSIAPSYCTEFVFCSIIKLGKNSKPPQFVLDKTKSMPCNRLRQMLSLYLPIAIPDLWLREWVVCVHTCVAITVTWCDACVITSFSCISPTRRQSMMMTLQCR